jgi:hypothetical protein
MDGPGASGGKVFGRFTEPAHQVLDLAREEAPRVVWTPLCGPRLVAKRALQLASEQAHALGHGEVRPEHRLLGVLEDAGQPADKLNGSRRHRQVIAHVGLPDGYHGAAGPLLAGLEIDLGRLREAVATELRGVRR